MSTSLGRRGSASIIAAVLATASVMPLAALATEADPVVFRIGTSQRVRPPELNPFRTTSGAGYTILADRYDLLVEFGEDLSSAPGLAESWETSPDGLTWTYHIREGAVWQDGTPVTAEDVRFTYQLIVDSHDPAYQGPQAPDGNDTNGDGDPDRPLSLFASYLDLDGGIEAHRIEEISAPDPQTVIIRTSEPIATLAQIFIPIVPKHIWETKTFAEAREPIGVEEAIGSGPFQVVQFEPATAIRLVAHEEHWGGAPHIDELIYQYFENDEAMVNALRDGSIDFIGSVPPTLVGALEADPNITVNRAPDIAFTELGFNSWDPTPERFEAEGCTDCERGPTTGSMGDPWLTRPEVRALLSSLVDKRHLIEFAVNGFGTPGVSIVSPLVPFFHYTPPPGDPLVFPEYSDEAGRDAARAQVEQRFRDEVAALGFTDTDGNGILNVPNTPEAQALDPEGAGQDWSLRLFIRTEQPHELRAGELITGWYEQAGVDIALEQVPEDPGFYTATYPESSNADYDMYIWGFGGDPDPDFILSIFSCDQINGWQDANYCDPEYDELYRQSRGETDPDARAEIVRQLQDKAFHEAPYAVLWYDDTVEAYRSDRFEGFNAMPRTAGSLWSTYGLGPWGSRTTVGPIGAAGATPPPVESPSPAPTGEPTLSPEPGTTPGPGATAEPGTPAPGTAVPTAGPTATAAPATPPPAAPTPTPSPAPGPGGTGGDTTPLIVGAGTAAVLGALLLLWLRRRRTDEDDEE